MKGLAKADGAEIGSSVTPVVCYEDAKSAHNLFNRPALLVILGGYCVVELNNLWQRKRGKVPYHSTEDRCLLPVRAGVKLVVTPRQPGNPWCPRDQTQNQVTQGISHLASTVRVAAYLKCTQNFPVSRPHFWASSDCLHHVDPGCIQVTKGSGGQNYRWKWNGHLVRTR